MRECDEPGCALLAETDFGRAKLCMHHASTRPGMFTLLPHEDGQMVRTTVRWEMPKYVSRRQLDKMSLILKMLGAA